MRLVPFESWSLRGRWFPTTRRRGVALAIVVHHSVTKATVSPIGSAQTVEEIIYQRRIKSLFAMVAYGWLIHPDGTIFEGRGAKWRNGANNNTRGGELNNGNTVSVCFIGDFRTDTVTRAAQQAFFELEAHLVATGVVERHHELVEHSALAETECAAGALAQVLADETPISTQQPNSDLTLGETDMIAQQCYDPATRQQVVVWHEPDEPKPCFDLLDKAGTTGTPIDNLVPLANLHWTKKG